MSSCLLGNKVRYDGKHSRNECIIDLFEGQFELTAFCPEVAIGLGIPRPPINLVSVSGEIRVLGVNDTSHDVTNDLINYAKESSKEFNLLSGYIFKSKSPSCGLADVNVYDSVTDKIVTTSAGQFANVIMQDYPMLPVADEIMLSDKKIRTDFIRRVTEYFESRKN